MVYVFLAKTGVLDGLIPLESYARCTRTWDTLILVLVSSSFTFVRLDMSLCTQPGPIVNYGSPWHVLGVRAFPKKQQVVVNLKLNDSLKL